MENDILKIEDFDIVTKLLIPFSLELKTLFKKSSEFRYIENEDKTVSPKSKSYIQIDGVGFHSIKEKYPIISVSRGAVSATNSFLGNQSGNQNIWDLHKRYGQRLDTNIHITVENHSKILTERLGSFIFNFFRYNKGIFRGYGMTDVNFNHISQAVPKKDGTDEKIGTWQVGINAQIVVYEDLYLEACKEETVVSEYEWLIKYVSGNSSELAMEELVIETPSSL